MSLHLPAREAWRSTSSIFSRSSYPKTKTAAGTLFYQRRNASIWDYFKRDKKQEKENNVLDIEKLMKGYKPPKEEIPQLGRLDGDSIFELEEGKDGSQETAVAGQAQAPTMQAMSAALNPKPWAQARWQRKKIIQAIQHRGRISKTEQILKQERFHVHASGFFKSSMKKVVPLARQMAGKTIDEALVQLRFSKKLAAVRLTQELKIARDEAIVAQGMGLGHLQATSEDGVQVGIEDVVPLKEASGKVRLVKPTAMYIDQAWVNKGKANRSIEYRARGRRNILKHHHTMISFLLKEEKTRMRLAAEREQKKADRRPWVHHPDRNIPTQRQHIMW